MRHQIKPVPNVDHVVLGAIGQVPMFDALTGDDVRVLAKHVGCFRAKAGELIVEEGERGEHLFFVVSGALDVYKNTEAGVPVVISTLRKGRTAGEMAMFDRCSRSATVRARVDSNTFVMSRRQFEHLINGYPGLGIRMLRGLSMMLSQNLRKTASRLADYMLPMA